VFGGLVSFERGISFGSARDSKNGVKAISSSYKPGNSFQAWKRLLIEVKEEKRIRR
jgi:hypothetical protein